LPSSTVDTFLACSVMILLVLSAMVGTSKLLTPYLYDLSNRDEAERFEQLATHILLSSGAPSNWGQSRNTIPTNLGLAKADSPMPYELDIDKVSRLNRENAYSLAYSKLWEAFGAKDAVFQIEVKPLFDVSISPISSSTLGNQTVYEFEIATKKAGMPVGADLSGYAVVQSFVDRAKSSTSSSGVGFLSASIPNSVNGTVLLTVFARAKANAQMVSFNTFAFVHNSSAPLVNGTFTKLSPLNHFLNASLLYSTIEILKAQIFTFNYNFSLIEKTHEVQSVEYLVPNLLDSSPMIMVLTGHNGSDSFAEWVSYPHLPFQIGASFNNSIAGTKIVSRSHIVTINAALYEVITKWAGTE